MPVFHTYKNKSGYYITARPSDVGNITYQTTTEADNILTDLGYGDEDDLPWGLINPLRSSGFIYTEGEGIDQDPADAPALDPEKLPQLSNGQLEEIVSYLESREDIPEPVFNQLQSMLTQEKSNILAEFEEALREQIPDQEISVSFNWGPDNKKIKIISITLEDDDVEHSIDNCSKDWTVMFSHEADWAGMAKAYESRPKIMRALAEVEDQLPFEKPWPNVGNAPFHL